MSDVRPLRCADCIVVSTHVGVGATWPIEQPRRCRRRYGPYVWRLGVMAREAPTGGRKAGFQCTTKSLRPRSRPPRGHARRGQ